LSGLDSLIVNLSVGEHVIEFVFEHQSVEKLLVLKIEIKNWNSCRMFGTF